MLHAVEIPERYGGLEEVLLANIDDIYNSFLRHFPTQCTVGNPSIEFSDNLTYNARVWLCGDGTPKYSFNLGALLAISDISSFISCDDYFCESIERKSRVIVAHNYFPSGRFCDYRYAFDDDRMISWPFSHMLEFPEELDCPRGRLGNHLMEFAIKFLGLHEQCHFMLGHLHYLKNLSLEASWLEAAQKASFNIPIADRHGLEAQADSLACHLCLTLLLKYPKDQRARYITKKGLHIKQTSKSDILYIYFALLGIAVNFAIIDRIESAKGRQLVGKSHPSAAARFLLILYSARQALIDYVFPFTDKDKWMEDILHDLVIMFNTIGAAPLSPEAFNEAFNKNINIPSHPQAIEYRSILKDAERMMQITETYKLHVQREYF